MAKRTTPVYHSSKSDDWYTPAHFIHAARLVMGSIDLDPASCAEANQTVEATRFYTVADDGLHQPWFGRVWLNPPYTRRQAGKWVAQLVKAYMRGEVDQALLLVRGSIDTKWYQPLYSYPRCAIEGRVKFSAAKQGAGFPSVVAYFGPDVSRFVEVFGSYGRIDVCLNPPSEYVQQRLWKETAHGTETHQPGA